VRILLGTLLLLVAGCATPPTPGPGDDAILLADWRQGMVPMAAMYDPPDFVLYGNGRAVVREEAELMKLVEYRLTPERVSTLFEQATEAGLLEGADYSLDHQVPDGGSLVIMLRTEEREHVVKIHVPNPEDVGPRGEAAAFAESLHPWEWTAEDFESPPKPYRPDKVAVTYATAAAPAEPDEPRTWPLPESEPIQPRCVVLTGPAAKQAQKLGETSPQTTVWHQGETDFHAWIRPLLPDETDCHATELRYLD
jgi:hypothetical protein